MKKKFSIITITFNNYKGIINTWNSLQAQSYDDWDWVVIDGGSTDGTIQWLQGLTTNKCNNKIAFSSESDDGIYDAMNKGITRASGEYLVFMNSGDYFASADVLSRANQVVIKESPDFMYCNSYEILENGEKRLKISRHHKWLWYGMFAHHQAMIFRGSTLNGLRYKMEYPIGADYAFVAEFLQRTNRIVKLDFSFCIFVRGGASTLKDGVVQGYIDQRNIRKKIMKMNTLSIALIQSLHKVVNFMRMNLPFLYYLLRGMK